jgi:hypothetical protein
MRITRMNSTLFGTNKQALSSCVVASTRLWSISCVNAQTCACLSHHCIARHSWAQTCSMGRVSVESVGAPDCGSGSPVRRQPP